MERTGKEAGGRGRRKRLLLLMGSETYRAPDFVAAAGRLGAELVVGTDAPGGAAALEPQAALALPFGDHEAALERIAGVHGRLPFDAVVAVDDTAGVLAAKVAAALGLPTNPVEAVVAASHKRVFREILRAAGLPSPWFRQVSLHEEPTRHAVGLPYPCVVKPVFLSASRGVIRVDTPEQYVAAFRRVQRLLEDGDLRKRGGADAEVLLIESFIPGAEAALEGLVVEGEFRLLAFFDKPDPLDGPFFEETLFVTPSRHPEPLQRAALEAVRAAVRAVGLRTGPVHAEVRLSGTDRPGDAVPYVLEIAPRSIGGHCSRTLEFGSGLSLEELILRQALALTPLPLDRERRAAGVMMIPVPAGGILHGVEGLDAARAVAGVGGVEITIPLTQPVVPWPEGHRYLGFIFAKGPTPAAVEAALRESHRRLRFDIRAEDSR